MVLYVLCMCIGVSRLIRCAEETEQRQLEFSSGQVSKILSCSISVQFGFVNMKQFIVKHGSVVQKLRILLFISFMISIFRYSVTKAFLVVKEMKDCSYYMGSCCLRPRTEQSPVSISAFDVSALRQVIRDEMDEKITPLQKTVDEIKRNQGEGSVQSSAI